LSDLFINLSIKFFLFHNRVEIRKREAISATEMIRQYAIGDNEEMIENDNQ